MNHWIYLYNQRKARFWTAEFTKSGVFVLSPRRVGVEDEGFSNHRAGVIFEEGSLDINDNEFIDFLHECKKDMRGMISVLRQYQSVVDELTSYELAGLTFDAYGMCNGGLDIKLDFMWSQIKVFAK